MIGYYAMITITFK